MGRVDLGSIRVVIVDDHAMFRDFMSVYIAHQGIEVVGSYGTAAAAFEAVVEHRPDLVLLDHNLPDLPGTEAIKRIKAEVPDTKVVMVTGSDEDSVLLDAVVAGCSGFVSKASTPSEVVNAIRSAVSGETVLPERIVRLIPRLSARPAHDLTPREIEILHYLVSGSSNRQIAQELFISLNTVRNHVQHVIEKLGAHTKLEAVTIAIRERIVRLASQS